MSNASDGKVLERERKVKKSEKRTKRRRKRKEGNKCK
jgi:hypothetical protein